MSSNTKLQKSLQAVGPVSHRKKWEPFEKRKLITPEPTRTKQSFKEECDINNILKKYGRTGQLPDLIEKDPIYGDFSEPTSYQEAMNLVILANEQFANLSAKTRERFSNDPVKFLEFTNNPENIDEMVKLGLAKKQQSNDDKNVNPPIPSNSQKPDETSSQKEKS